MKAQNHAIYNGSFRLRLFAGLTLANFCYCKVNQSVCFNANEINTVESKIYNIDNQNTNIWQINRGFTSDSLETVLDTLGLITQLNKIPAQSKGLGMIDWEGEIEKRFLGDTSSAAFKKTLADHITIVQIAKRVRPNLKWGFYGYPISNYWSRDSAWRQGNNKLQTFPK